MTITRRQIHQAAIATAATSLLGAPARRALAATAEDLHKDADQALANLYKQNPTAAMIGNRSKATLVFPKILKAGLIFGGAYGEGVLMRGGKVVDYYLSLIHI